MDKVLAPLDGIIAGIGRFIMVKPRFAGLLLIVILGAFISAWNIKLRLNEEVTTIAPNSANKATTAVKQITVTSNAPTQTTNNITANNVTSSPTTSGLTVVTVEDGDSLAAIFQRLHLSPQELYAVMHSGPATRVLLRLRPGQIINFTIADNQLQQLTYPRSKTEALIVTRTDAGFKSHLGLNSLPNAAMPTIATSAPADLPPVVPSAGAGSNKVTTTAANWTTVTVQPGDTLAGIFSQLHISAKELQAVADADKPNAIFRKMRPGDSLRFYIINQEVEQLIYSNTKLTFSFTRDEDNGFTRQAGITALPQIPTETVAVVAPTPVNLVTKVPELTSANRSDSLIFTTPTHFVSTEIHGSLYLSLKHAGLPNKYALQMGHIFSQYSNLNKVIQWGDRVAVLYQEQTKDNNQVVRGGILAAELTTKNGKTYQLVQFKDPTGKIAYYTPNGTSLHPPIERAPVRYKYISSYFSTHRWQPILHFFRPHEGVDYAAHEGTPIKAAGNGRIIYSGRKGGYGNTLIIKHDTRYSTLYAHLSRYAPHIHNGTYVKQNQVIGYVGHTGLATGPHLHFEIHVNNVAQNPLTVALPTGTPLPKSYRHEFFAQTKPLLAQLATHQQVYLAAQSSTTKNS